MKIFSKYIKIIFVFSCIGLLSAAEVFSQINNKKSTTNTTWSVKPFQRKAFIENKGQFDNNLPADKKSFNYCIDNGYQLFFYPNEICYRFKKKIKSKGTILNFFESEQKREAREHSFKTETQYINVKWLNANPDAKIVVEDKQSTYYSYVVKNVPSSCGIGQGENNQTIICGGFSKLIYKDLYPNIDVEYVFHPDNGIEYNLLVHPGADITKVQMQYVNLTDHTPFSISRGAGGEVHIKTIKGDIIDHAPVTFYASTQETSASSGASAEAQINSSFNITNNIISFNVSPYLNDQEIIIDPWTVVPGFTPSEAYDNGTDNSGNIYIYGGNSGNFIVEKYANSGGAALWSLASSGIDEAYYGDMLVEGNGNFYLSEGFVGGGAHTSKFSPTSASVWQSTSDPSFREHWRLALNCITNRLIVAGGGTTSPTLNIAEIDVVTGALVNAKSVFNQSQSDVAGLCVDDLGQAYLKHSNPNIITFTDNGNNFVANIQDGYNISEVGIGGTPSYYPAMFTNGYNFMALGGTTFLFTSDGAVVKKWDRNTHLLISSATIPGGQQNLGSGILADKCNNIFVGASDGVHRFDFNLVQKEFHATTAAVYDIAYAINSDIVASGSGFLTPIPFGRESCGANLILMTSDPCNPEINTVKVRPTTGTAPFSFFWDDGSTDSIRTNLLLGNHIVTVRSGACNPSFSTDTIKISNDSHSFTVQKTNPLCDLGSDGQIKITLLHNQTVVSYNFTPTVTSTQLNDSTIKATGLTSGSYSCHIVSSLGCSFDTIVTLIATNANPIATFGDTKACDGFTMPFTESSSTAVGILTTWSWNFGDSSPLSPLQNPTHLYANTGTYPVSLIVTNSNGCKDTMIKNVVVHPVPNALFSTENVCKGSIVPFNDLSTIAAPDVLQFWSWNFGDATPLNNNQNTLHLYAAIGTYTVQLLVVSNFGCRDSISKAITINPNPVVVFSTPDTVGCNPLCVNFQNSSTIATGSNASLLWNFGDGTTSAQASNHCFINNSVFTPSTFEVSLTVTSDSGCVSILAKNSYITVNPNPIADINVDKNVTSIIDPIITFTNLSSGENAWSWNFGDNTTSSIEAPLPHSYADTGRYQITLIVSNQYSCYDTTNKTIVIEPDWALFIPNTFTPNGDGINETFQGIGFGLLEYEMMIFDRWGNKIYETKKYNDPWDGKANTGSEMAQIDSYVYLINIKDVKKIKHSYRGIINLVK